MPFENSTINIETVQHPTLGPLKFPSDMPYEQRNQLIESLEAEQKASTKTDSPQPGSRSQPRIANGQGDAITIGARILGQRPLVSQRYFPQLEMPAGSIQPEAPSKSLLHTWGFPDYGAPPDHASSNHPTLGSSQYADPTDNIAPRQFSGLSGPSTQGRAIDAHPNGTNGSFWQNYSRYLSPNVNPSSPNNLDKSFQSSPGSPGREDWAGRPFLTGTSSSQYGKQGTTASQQNGATQARKTDPNAPVIQPTKELTDYRNLAHSLIWPFVPDKDKKKLADLVDSGQASAANNYARQVAQQLIVNNPGFASFDKPSWVYVDPNVAAHDLKYVLPDDPGDKRWQDLRQLLVPRSWQAIPGEDKYRLSQLMHDGKFDEANQYAQAIRSGKWPPGRPTGPPSLDDPIYPGLSVDNLVDSPYWQKVPPQLKKTLGTQIAMGNMEGSDTIARALIESLKQAKTNPVNDVYSLQNSEMWSSISSSDKEKIATMIKQNDRKGADQYARGLAIAETAKRYEGNKQWAVEVVKDKFKAGDDKCNEFVFDVMREMGLEVPGIAGWSGLLGMGGPPAAAQWAERSKRRIGNWEIVDGPAQPGDVIAEFTGGPEHPNWAHVGIVVGDRQTASADTLVYPKGRIVINDWGFRPDDLKQDKVQKPGIGRVVRRYMP
jgi:hypothetical protein